MLGHGSVHQGGYVFALDDTPPLTESVGGKVLATAESAPMHWSPTATPVPGIYIDSTVAEGGCEGAIDGQCNTRRILAQYPTDSRDFAAAACEDSRHGGYAGWYLPEEPGMGSCRLVRKSVTKGIAKKIASQAIRR